MFKIAQDTGLTAVCNQVFARDVGTTAPQEVARVSEVSVQPSKPSKEQPEEADKLSSSKIDVPVRLNSSDQDTTIYPGDILIADLNGVVCLPQGLAEQAIDLIGSQVEADERMAADIKNGITFSEASKKHRAGVKQPAKLA